jgi:hypothetical protein
MELRQRLTAIITDSVTDPVSHYLVDAEIRRGGMGETPDKAG